jgi:hypothetical protein
LLDVKAYEELQESLAFLKILAQSRKSISAGRSRAVTESFRRIRSRARRLILG